MFDEKFVRRFNSETPNNPCSMEQIIEMYNSMPDQRVGALFDLARWVKKSEANASRVILINERMNKLPPTPSTARYILE